MSRHFQKLARFAGPGILTGLCALLLVPLSACRMMPWKHAAYDVSISGLQDRTTVDELRTLSSAWQYRRDKEVDTRDLDLQFRSDAVNMTRYLHARGYCDASVTSRVVRAKSKPRLEFTVYGTNVYRIHDVTIEAEEMSDYLQRAWTNDLAGSVVNFERIAAGGRQLVDTLQNTGYPYAALDDMTVMVDHEERLADILYQVTPGPVAVLGDWSVEGLNTVSRRFLEQRVTWTKGDPYRKRTVSEFSRRLSESGLFGYVDLSGLSVTSAVYDVRIHVTERKRHTIGLGIGYQSDIGPGATVLWQHRNLFGMGQRFTLDAKYSENLWLGSAVLALPRVFRGRHDLEFGLRASEEDSDAYFVRYGLAYARVQNNLSRHLTLGYGPALRRSLTEQLDEERNYLQASFPVVLQWNHRNRPLDSTRGFAVTARAEPTQSVDAPERFVKSTFTPTVYVPLHGDALVLSGRLTLGSITGSDRDGIPADLRFYAGGGQSIRGYAYQSVSPREEGLPVGGKSLVESSLELRWRFARHLGAVAFLDGGSAYEPTVTDFRESYQWGAGAGFRYFTAIGPIRADIGFPINPREDIDSSFEFYISIGQAF